ncbi:protein kinase C-binding protein NELL1-like isoform X1 [Homalodisca vitripennis]|uniref:protein kinase C-binding protein NELL1-like isoform X1 n=1 Tax=Homalodisca vitripennis TaxID=197043 RepID=UPI001EEBA896|nr:protein kinase C-binding protein NELL1-like isoform X1 [Homalodisca vitripennis]
MAFTYWVLFALCGSVLGILPGNNTTGIPCENHYDCEPGKACIDFQCEDPCLGLCGLNTICHVVGEVSMCSCKPGFIGQPFNGCFPEVCTMNSDCPEENICSDHLCKDACKDTCGLNSVCKAVKHRAICSCNPGYVWKPFLGCHVESRKIVIQMKCTRDSDCSLNSTCSNDECVDPCIGVCGNNTVCNVMNHRAACACKSGFIGDPFLECVAQNTSIPENITKKYKIGNDEVTWYTAIQRCRYEGMRLASIMNESEQAEMRKSIARSPGTLVWTSGNDLSSKGHYVWDGSGNSFDYTNWGQGEPEISDKYRCIAIKGNVYTWLTANCHALTHYACEYFEN